MTTRVLPVSEWSRLEPTELGSVWQSLDPERTEILVVEDEDAIVGCWARLTVEHAEGLWIAEGYRGGTVARRLLHAMRDSAQRAGVGQMVTGSVSDEVSGLIQRIGGTQVPGSAWVIPMGGR